MGMMAVEGKVTQAGAPLANVQIVLTDLETGRTFKAKANKSGQFTLAGVTFGNFRVDVLGEKGEKLHSQQASIQGDLVRVTAKDRDTLQEIIAMLRGQDFGIDMQFTNYRSN